MSRSEEKKAQSRSYFMALTAVFMLFLSVGGLLWINEAQALRISMKRIIFEGPKRSDIITIMNNTAREQTYRLGWRHYRMDEERSLVRVDENDPAMEDFNWADDMIRYAPRRVTVPPGGSQQIRILLRRPRDLAEGEYRSHLWIVTEAPTEEFAPGDAETAGQQSFQLSMMPALTLPIFVRHGDLTASARITDMTLAQTDEGGSVSFNLHREGNRSLYGDLKVICTGGSQEYVANHTRGIAVYTEVNRRFFEFDFTYPPEHAADCRKVRVEYVADSDDNQYSGQVMAQASASM